VRACKKGDNAGCVEARGGGVLSCQWFPFPSTRASITHTRYDHVLECEIRVQRQRPDNSSSSSANLRKLKTLAKDGTVFHHLSSFTDSNPFPHPSSVITPNSLTLNMDRQFQGAPGIHFPTECPVVSFLTCPHTFNLQVLLHSPTTVPNPTPACSCSRPICSVLRPIAPQWK